MHYRFKLYIQRIANECLPWVNIEDNQCPLCKAPSDTYPHLFKKCLFITITWRESEWGIWDVPASNIIDLIEFICDSPIPLLGKPNKENLIRSGAILLYNLWIERNNIVYSNDNRDLFNFLHKNNRIFAEHYSSTDMYVNLDDLHVAETRNIPQFTLGKSFTLVSSIEIFVDAV